MATNAEEFLIRLKSNIAPVATKDEKALQALDAQIRAAQRAMQGLDAKAAQTAAQLATQQKVAMAASEAVRAATRNLQTGKGTAAELKAAQAKLAQEGKALAAMRERAAAAREAADVGRKELAILKSARPELAKQAEVAKKAAAAKALWKDRATHVGSAIHAMGGPLSTWLSKMQTLAPMTEISAAALVSLGAVALSVVLVGGLVAAYGALIKFGLGAAAAAREARILGDALEGVSRRPGKEFVAVVDQLARQVPLARGQLQEMAKEMALLKLGGRDLQTGLTAVATVTSALGDGAGRNVRAIVEQSAALRRFTLGARDLWGQYQMLSGTGLTKADVIGALAKQLGKSAGEVEKMLLLGQIKLKDGLRALEAASKARFGKTIEAQMLDVNTQLLKAKEAFAGMFKGINLEPVLVAMRDFLRIFDESTVSGKVLKGILTAGFQGLVDLMAAGFPIARRFFYGMATAALELYIALAPTIFRIARVIKEFIGAKGAIDAFSVGKAAVIGIAVAIGVVIAAMTAALTPFALATAAIYAIVKIGVAGFRLLSRAIDAVGEAIDAAQAYLAGIDWSNLGTNIVDGIVRGITQGIPKFVGSIVDLAKSGIRAFTTANQIQSPAKLYTKAAVQIPPGAARGVDQAAPVLARSVADMSLAAAPEVRANMPELSVGAPGGGTTVNVSFNAPVHIGGGESKEAFADWLIARITGALQGGAPEGAT